MLREMVQKSTIIKRDVEMTLNEYLNVKHNSTFLDGIVYAWFSRKWSKNVASFELQKNKLYQISKIDRKKHC